MSNSNEELNENFNNEEEKNNSNNEAVKNNNSILEEDLEKKVNLDIEIEICIEKNLAERLNKILAICKNEDILKHFEKFLYNKNESNSKKEILKVFINNVKFQGDDSNLILDLIDIICNNQDIKTLEVFIQRNTRIKNIILNYIIKKYDLNIDFIENIIKWIDDGTIEEDNVSILLSSILEEEDTVYDYMSDIYEDSNERALDNADFHSKTIELLIKKSSNNSKEKIFDYLKSLYFNVPNNLSDNCFRQKFYKPLQRFFNILPQELIENYIQKTDYMSDSLIKSASSKPEEFQNIVKAVQGVKEKTEMPDMSMFDEKITSGVILSVNEMNDLCKSLKLLRLKLGYIPEEYCDFVLKNTILEKGEDYYNNSDFLDIFPLCILDRAHATMEKEKLDNIIIVADRLPDLEGGRFGNSKITISISNIYQLPYCKFNGKDCKNLMVINTIFHEIQHAIQNKHIEDNNLQNFAQYNMIKEKILSSKDLIFYDTNYKDYTAEVDARISGRKRMYEYLLSIGIPMELILENNLEFVHNKSHYKTYEEYLVEESTKLYNDKSFSTSNRIDKQNLDSLFDKIIAENPNILTSENGHPALKYEYNEDGTRKGYLEVLQEYETRLLSDDYVEPEFNLSEYLINKDIIDEPELSQTVMKKDAQILKQYFPKTEKGKELINVIIDKMRNYANYWEHIIKENNFQYLKNKYHMKPHQIIELKHLIDIINHAIDEYYSRIDGTVDKSKQILSDDTVIQQLSEIDTSVTDEQRKDLLLIIKNLKNIGNQNLSDKKEKIQDEEQDIHM